MLNNEEEIKQYKVYVHINKMNGKLYIGQTKLNVNERWQNGKGYKNCTLFNRAIKKYTWNNFLHIVLFENLSLEIANIIEETLIEKYNTLNPLCGYNLSSGGYNKLFTNISKYRMSKSQTGSRKSSETRKKMSEAQKGEKHHAYGKKFSSEHIKNMSKSHKGYKFSEQRKIDMSISHKYCMTPINQYSLSGEFISKFESIRAACRQLNFKSPQAISACAKGKVKTSYGYLWKYAELEEC